MNAQTPFIPRATRYRIVFPLRFRTAGESAWSEGRSENVSRTGLLFCADRILSAQMSIEMLLEMPAEVAASGGVHLRRARIVRAVPASPRGRQPACVAAAFELDYTHPDDPRRI